MTFSCPGVRALLDPRRVPYTTLFRSRVVPESRLATERRRYDPFGAVTVTGGLSLLVYAVSTAPRARPRRPAATRSEEHTSELQSRGHLVCRLLLEKKK